MPIENDFLPVATEGTPNVQDQTDYAGSLVQEQGWATNQIPPANVFNKMIRQASSIAAAIAQAVVDQTGLTMIDDGNIATLEAKILALLSSASQISYLPDTGAANAYVITPATAITAYTGGQSFYFIPAHVNTGASTLAVSGLAAKSIVHPDGSVLQSGDIPASGLVQVVYQATMGKFVLMTNASSFYSFGASGYFRIPGTAAFFQWATFSINATNSTVVPSGFVWGTQAITFPISPTPNNQLYVYGFSINEAVNGPMATGCATMGSGAGTIYITTNGSYTQPVAGIVWQIAS